MACCAPPKNKDHVLQDIHDPSKVTDSSQIKLRIHDGQEDAPEHQHLVVGPVIGSVTTCSARVLVEVSMDAVLTCTLTPKPRDRAEAPSMQNITLAAVQDETSLGDIDAKQDDAFSAPIPSSDITKAVSQSKSCHGGLAEIFVLNGLQEKTRYQVNIYSDSVEMAQVMSSFYTMPGEDAVDLRIGLTSCNKISVVKQLEPEEDLWLDLARRVERDELDLVLHLGDQVYADDMMHDVEGGKASLRDVDCKFLLAKSLIEAEKPEDWPKFEAQISELYRDIYRETWSHPPTKTVLANVPNVMIMDDHEIRDDWGDDPDDQDKSTIDHFIARLGFKVFCEYQGQLYLDIPFDNDAYLHTKQHRIFKVNNHTGVLLVDMRAARTFHNNLDDTAVMLGTEQWDDIDSALFADDGELADIDTLLFGAGVPLCFYHSALSDFLGSHVSAVDDLLGHWCHDSHKPEQERVFNSLDKWKQQKDCREVVVLGGDVHVGGFTSLKKEGRNFALQFFSSSIGNARFSPMVETGIRMMGGDLAGLSDEVVNEQFGFYHHKWIADRNYGLIQVVPYTGTENQRNGGQRCFCHLVQSSKDKGIHDGPVFKWIAGKKSSGCCCIAM